MNRMRLGEGDEGEGDEGEGTGNVGCGKEGTLVTAPMASNGGGASAGLGGTISN